MVFTVAATAVAYQTVLTFVYLALYETLGAAFGVRGPLIRDLFIVLSLTFTTASLLAFRYANKFVSRYYLVSAYWFGLANFMFFGGFAFFLAELILAVFSVYVPPALVGAVTFGVSFVLHCYATWNSSRLRTTTVRVSLSNLPEEWRGKRIAFVSDVHLGDVRGERFAWKVVDMLHSLNPEAVFIGGDLFDGERCDPEQMPEALATLDVPRGVFFVSGNHEYRLKNVEGALRAVQDLGIRILNNEKVDLGGIDLIGVDYKAVRHKKDFEKVMGDITVDRSRPTILLKHVPHHIDVAEQAGVSLGLYGHTHKGQVWPLTYLTRRAYKGFDYGHKEFGAMQVYTSSGAGTWGPPLRLGTTPEVVCVEFI